MTTPITPRRILVVRIDKVGDLILATPAMRNLRDEWPAAQLTVLVSPQNRAVLEGSDCTNNLVQYDRAWNLLEKLRTIATLRAQGFELVLVLSPTFESYLVAFLTGAPVRTGVLYSRRIVARCFSPLMLTHASVMRIEEALARGDRVPHEVEQSLMAIEALGIPTRPLPLELAIDSSARAWANDLFEQGLITQPFAALHLSDGWFASGGNGSDVHALLEHLLERTELSSVVITHGPADQRAFAELQHGVRLDQAARPDDTLLHRAFGGRVKVVGNLPFARWAALLASARIVISRDTGALHVAAALSRPVVAIYEARTFALCSQQWAPWMVPYRTLRACRWPELIPAIATAATDLIGAIDQAETTMSETLPGAVANAGR